MSTHRTRRLAVSMLASLLAAAAGANAQTCGIPIPLQPDVKFLTGSTCGSGEQNILLCDSLGESGPAVVYRIDAEHLSGRIDTSANLSMLIVAKNADCRTGDCISVTPGDPILFTPDMEGPFSVVVAADPRLETPGTCGTYSLAPDLRVIDDLVKADGFDRSPASQ